MADTAQVRRRLLEGSPELCNEIKIKAAQWTAPVIKSLKAGGPRHGYPKVFNDPIWGVITLYPWETLLLDSPLLQRLRGVRQLGMAHHVYPGANHDRLEHSRGVVEAAERMITALQRNADFRRQFGDDRDDQIPTIDQIDYTSTRLAALLHDIGHTSFSHTTEDLLRQKLSKEFTAAENRLREHFDGVTNIAPSEVIAALIVLSEPMQEIFEHPRFEAVKKPSELPLAISARILGSRSFLKAGYLSGVISGPIDADKLDYMARDSHHAGLPLGLDLARLISKLEVVSITPENATNPELRKRATESSNKRAYEIGISLSGLGAYEQMIIGRVILYDRLYHHHKVRAAEAMVRRLVMLAEEEIGKPFTISELFCDVPDDTALRIFGGELQLPGQALRRGRSAELSVAIQNREIYYRAFAFAPRFIGGLACLPEKEQKDAKAILWPPVLSDLATLEGRNQMAQRIYEIALQLKNEIAELSEEGELQPEHILVDLPGNRVVVRGGDILTRTEDGQVDTPNLYFDPERWSQAYEHQKQCGFVFTQRRFLKLVGVAARIVFYEKYNLIMDRNADRACKTSGIIKGRWFSEAAKHGICTTDCADAFTFETPRLIPIRKSDLEPVLPGNWQTCFPEIVSELADSFQEAMPSGFAPSVHTTLLKALGHLISFLDTMDKGGDLVNLKDLHEKQFQQTLRNHLRAREADLQEGTEVGGGETDLILSNSLVIENKVVDKTKDPFAIGEKFPWQARRYSISISRKVAIVVVAYQPKDESAVLPLNKRLRVRLVGEPTSEFAEVRFVVPWGYPVPSKAQPPCTQSERGA